MRRTPEQFHRRIIRLLEDSGAACIEEYEEGIYGAIVPVAEPSYGAITGYHFVLPYGDTPLVIPHTCVKSVEDECSPCNLLIQLENAPLNTRYLMLLIVGETGTEISIRSIK